MADAAAVEGEAVEEEYLSYFGRRGDEIGTEIRVPLSSLDELQIGMNESKVTNVKAIFVDKDGNEDHDARLVYDPSFTLRMIRGGKSYPAANCYAECHCFIFRDRQRPMGCCH